MTWLLIIILWTSDGFAVVAKPMPTERHCRYAVEMLAEYGTAAECEAGA